MRVFISFITIVLLCGIIVIGMNQLHDPIPAYAMLRCCNNLGSVHACDDWSGTWSLKYKNGYETTVGCETCEDMWQMGYFNCNDSHNINGKYWCGSDWECSNPFSSNGCYVGSTQVGCVNYCSDKYYTLTISTTSGGTTSPAPGTHYRPRNQNTQVTASAYSGYYFSHWSGSASGSTNPLSLYMNGNKSITSNFALLPLTVSISGPSYIAVPNKGQPPYTATWTANASGGQSPYSFTWYRKIGAGSYYQVGTGSTYSTTYTYNGYNNDRDVTLKVVVVDALSNSANATKSVFEDSYPYELMQQKSTESTSQIGTPIPDYFILYQNYPNPFNPTTAIKFTISAAQQILLVIYDQQGRLVRELLSGYMDEGSHEVVWDGKNAAHESCASGVYVCVLRGGMHQEVKRLTLIH